MTVAESSMIFRSLHALGLADATLATKVFKYQLPNFHKAATLEIYSILDILTDLCANKLTALISRKDALEDQNAYNQRCETIQA